MSSQPRVDLVLRQLDTLPALPAVAARVLEATADDAPDAKRVTRLIESDPAIAARVLQAARRADNGARSVASVERAVVRLGFRGVRNLVLALGVVNVLDQAGTADEGAFSRGDFWQHCLAVACAAELLAPKCRVAKLDAGEAFCCGLLHDLGKLALHATLPKAYASVLRGAERLRCDISDVERQLIGIDHATAGRRLCEKWNLPAAIRDATWLHNAPTNAMDLAEAGHTPLVHLVTLGDQLARRLRLGYSGNHSFGTPRDELLAALQLDTADVAACLRNLVPTVKERGELLGLSAGDTEQLYRRAVERADAEVRVVDAELSAVRAKLREHQRELNAERARHAEQRGALRDQAQTFEALTKLAGSLAADASVRDVLKSIAAVAGVTVAPANEDGSLAPVLAYSHPTPDDDAAVSAELLLLADGQVALHDAVPVSGPPAEGNEPPTWLKPAVERAFGTTAAHALSLDVGGIIWSGGTPPAEIAPALVAGWTMALQLAQSRERQRLQNERLLEANRNLSEAREQMARDRATLAVAELAAGAAHEMNNPLMVISGRSQLLYRELSNLRHKQAALAVYHNAGRLSQMITQLMRFARPSGAEPRAASVREIVDEAVKLMAVAMEEEGSLGNRRLDRLVSEDLPAVQIDVPQWARALAAVLENAVQATADDGTVTIRADRDLAGGAVVLTVYDDGCGMDAEALRHAFDPFFSKKPSGRRRGMGLATALRLVETGGGTLSLDSREGEGTRAIFTIPLASATTSDARRASA